MENNRSYVTASLELHLFFARIMKEHALFLRAGFTARDVSLIQQAEHFQQMFEQLLAQAVNLSDCTVGSRILNSGEIVTAFTAGAEEQTQCLTGICINQAITAQESRLRADENPCMTGALVQQVRQLNQSVLHPLNGLIEFKEYILSSVGSCCIFTANYPLLIEHILREAKLYRDCLSGLECGRISGCQDLRQMELFWNQIMMEHALFIRGLLDPTETTLIEASNNFAGEYSSLLAQAEQVNDAAFMRQKSLQETLKFKEFKTAGTVGLQDCKIRSVILPLLADHVLREANHFIRILE